LLVQLTSNSTLEQTRKSLCLVWDKHKLTQYFIHIGQWSYISVFTTFNVVH